MSDDVAFYAPTSPRHYRGNRNRASRCSSSTESGITRVGAAELRDHGETYGTALRSSSIRMRSW